MTFRPAALLIKAVSTLDALSGGRAPTRRPRILIGGMGEKRTLPARLVEGARLAAH